MAWTIDDLPTEGRAYVTALTKCLELYLPSKHDSIEFMIAFNVKAIIRIEGSNLTKPLLAELISNLNRYKKYYPEKIDGKEPMILADILEEFDRRLAAARPPQGATDVS